MFEARWDSLGRGQFAIMPVPDGENPASFCGATRRDVAVRFVNCNRFLMLSQDGDRPLMLMEVAAALAEKDGGA